MPLFLKIDCHDDMLESGLILKEVIDFCKDAKEYGVNVLNISRGNIITAVGNAFNEFAVHVARKLGYDCPDKILSGYTDSNDINDYIHTVAARMRALGAVR